MQKAIAIIGMNFGDEGKGHITNFLSDEKTLNIRFNGGAQSAHAVFLNDGRNHIFHQFGSGSMKGARTLFGSHLIVNPIFFVAEWAALSDKTSLREVFIDPRCRITTPYDMFINEFSSYWRKKNDTTGIGINETVERSQFRQLRICMRDLIDKDEKNLISILKKIKEEYVPWRIQELKLPYNYFQGYLSKMSVSINQIEDVFINTIKSMLEFVVVWPDYNLIDRYLKKERDRKIVFEGAQGFRLDQNRISLMPYLTRSNTGLQNVFDCLKNVKTKISLDVYLVTRSYLTRHGEGPLWNEVEKPYDNVEEPTNPNNPYQGKMRYGYLNKTWYDEAINETRNYIKRNYSKSILDIKLSVAFTCLDQIDNNGIIYSIDSEKDFIVGSINDFSEIELISNSNVETGITKLNKKSP